MSATSPSPHESPYPGARLAVLGVLAVMILLPVTLPVTVLRGLVQERFGVSEFLTSLFMSVNMLGAVIAAPLAGALADRVGRRRELIVA
ncbi:MAG: MFS transporter, partial [Myxococcota bacterium]